MPLTLPHTLTAGTNENVGDVQDNFAEIANAFPVTSTNITDTSVTTAKIATGAITPHKYLTVAHVSAVTSHNFSGLNGNADYGYELIVMGVVASHPGGVVNFHARQNGTALGSLTGRSVYTRIYGTPVSEVAEVSNGGFLIGRQDVNGGFHIQATIQAKDGSERTSSFVHTHWQGTIDVVNQRGGTVWTDTTTDITSLLVSFGGTATFTGMLTLRKLGEV